MGSRKNFYVDQHVAFRVERAAFPARSPHPLIGNIFRSALCGLASFSLIRRPDRGGKMSHFRCEFDVVQRSQGESAPHKSAYQLRGRYTAPGGKIFDYSSRDDHVATIMLAPADAPAWAKDPNEYWRRAARAEKRWDAQEARIIQLSLPRGLSRAHWEDIARKVGLEFVKHGLVVQVDIHCTTASDGGENPHLHFLISMRALRAGVFAATKDRLFNSRFHARARILREEFAEFLNAYCKKVGVSYHADARSNAARGLPLAEPNLPRWNFAVFQRTGVKPPLLAQRDRERELRKKIACLEAECRELEREISLLAELPAAADRKLPDRANPQTRGILAQRDRPGPLQRLSPPKIRLAAGFENIRGTDPPRPMPVIPGEVVAADVNIDEAPEELSSWHP
jgi:MobA/MobL family